MVWQVRRLRLSGKKGWTVGVKGNYSELTLIIINIATFVWFDIYEAKIVGKGGEVVGIKANYD